MDQPEQQPRLNQHLRDRNPAPGTPESAMTPRLRTRERVMFFDTDAGGVVHNIAYLRFIETNRSLLAEMLGYALGSMLETGLCPVVVRTEIDYRRPARLWDELVVDGWLEKFGRTRFWCGFEIAHATDQRCLVTCRQALAVVKLPELRVQRLPETWNRSFEHLRVSATESAE